MMISGNHDHECPKCEARWPCYQVTHCKRPFVALCPDHALEDQARQDVARAVEINKPLFAELHKIFFGR